MKYFKFVVLIFIILLTSGCWNYRELNELAIVSSIGIDMEGDKFLVSVEVVNSKKAASISPSGASGGDESPVTIYQKKSDTIKHAINSIALESPYELYVGHISLLAIGEEAAKKGIYNYIDYFMGDIEVRKIFPVVVVEEGKASDLLKVILPLVSVTADHLRSALETEARVGSYLSNRKFDEILACLYTPGRHATISSVKIIGSKEEGQNSDTLKESKPKTSIKITGSAVLKKDKLVGYLHNEDSLGYTIVRNMAKTMEINFPCDKKGNHSSVIVDNVKTALKVKFKDKKPVYDISVTGQAAIPSYNCKLDLNNTKGILKVEKMVNEKVEKIIKSSMKKIQTEYKSDIVGFGELLYREHNKYWKKVSKNWDEKFSSVKYKVKSKINIESVASTNKPAKEVQ